MEKARDKFKVGDVVEVLVKGNSRYMRCGEVFRLSEKSPYHLFVKFADGTIQGYSVRELGRIPRLGQSFFDALDRIDIRKLANIPQIDVDKISIRQ